MHDTALLAKHGVTEITATPEDLRNTVLAENITIRKAQVQGFFEVSFDFLCPNCGRRHWATEFAIKPLFSTVGWTLLCGVVNIRMPWAQTPEPDSRSIYGRPRRER
jgi:hypothetical protein